MSALSAQILARSHDRAATQWRESVALMRSSAPPRRSFDTDRLRSDTKPRRSDAHFAGYYCVAGPTTNSPRNRPT